VAARDVVAGVVLAAYLLPAGVGDASLTGLPPEAGLAVFFLGSTPGIDLAGAELLGQLHHALRERGIAFRLAEARGEVRDSLCAGGFEQRRFPVVPIQPVALVISEWRRNA
jgi:MFS superfamily sulfate permease-like transporter